jgi:hypothetical protein
MGMSKLDEVRALREARELRRAQSNHERRNEGKADAVPVARTTSEMPQASAVRAPANQYTGRVAKGIKTGVKSRCPSVQNASVPLAGRRAAHELTGPDISVSTKALKRGRPRFGEVRDKPWLAAGMSRRTWYRRKAEERKP